MNSFLRWAGSKRKVLPILLAHAPSKFGRYVEPFAGSACLFFALTPKQAILGDINHELINTYRELQNNVAGVIQSLRSFGSGATEYYRVRDLDSTKLSATRRASRFIYLNRFCFNGLYRTNKKGTFNVPYGGQKSGMLPSADTLRACAKTLVNAELVSSSFEATLDLVEADDFVYLDPPYSISSRRVFNEYSNFNFGTDELVRLRSQLVRLDGQGVRFLASYGLSKEARAIGKGFRCREIVVQRQIAGFAANRRKSRELLITNY